MLASLSRGLRTIAQAATLKYNIAVNGKLKYNIAKIPKLDVHYRLFLEFQYPKTPNKTQYPHYLCNMYTTRSTATLGNPKSTIISETRSATSRPLLSLVCVGVGLCGILG
jgi:hypothetical protein